jgi:uncharacterized membrane protein
MILGVPLYLRKIPLNGWYGFRTPDTLANPELWYKVNRYAGREMMIYGVYWILITLITHHLNLTPPIGTLVWAGMIWVGMYVVVIRGFLYQQRLMDEEKQKRLDRK